MLEHENYNLGKVCKDCGVLVSNRSTGRCHHCAGLARRQAPLILTCSECGKVFVASKRQRDQWQRSGRAYCSQDCSKTATIRMSSERMARTNRKYASERMIRNNPMTDPLARVKMSETLRRIGHRPSIRGGNGHGPTEPQFNLSKALNWPMEVIVKTGHWNRDGAGYPSHYKLDIANVELRIGIEIDGGSHKAIARQAQDAKKDALLRGLGWTVLRFSNATDRKSVV